MTRIVPESEHPAPQVDPDDLETLASVEHSQWQVWTEHMLDKIEDELAGMESALGEFSALPSVRRWRLQIELDYLELTEEERESDRVQVRCKLPLYRPM